MPMCRLWSSIDMEWMGACPHPCALQINYLIASSQLLVQMKRKELAYKARQRQRAAKADTQKAGGKKDE
jgi:hypothetical protein